MTHLRLAVAFPALLLLLAVYGRDHVRTFCIGALIPASLFPVVITYVIHADQGDSMVAVLAMNVGLAAVVGLLAVWVRSLVERPRQQLGDFYSR